MEEFDEWKYLYFFEEKSPNNDKRTKINTRIDKYA